MARVARVPARCDGGMNVQAMSVFFALLTVFANLFVVVAVVLWVAARRSRDARSFLRAFRDWVGPAALPFAASVATVATLGSLHYSEIAHYIPCKLCWYQRIGMYPLAIVLWIAAAKRDPGVKRYVLPVAAIASLISIYHYQLERFPAQTSLGCTLDAPCTVVWVWQFHYISLPFMALSGFALIATLLLMAPRTPNLPARPVEQVHQEALR
jgi:disulfide bond formation protein DsbB